VDIVSKQLYKKKKKLLPMLQFRKYFVSARDECMKAMSIWQ